MVLRTFLSYERSLMKKLYELFLRAYDALTPKISKLEFYDYVIIRHDGIGDQIIWDEFLPKFNINDFRILLVCPSYLEDYLHAKYSWATIAPVNFRSYAFNLFYRFKIR